MILTQTSFQLFFQYFDPKCEILHAIINSRVSVSYIRPTVLFPCLLSFKLKFRGPESKCSEGLSSSIRPRLWSPLWVSEHSLLGGKSPQLWLYSNLWVTIQRCGFLLYHISAPRTPHTHLVVVSLYNISCIKSFLLVCKSFSSTKRFHLVWPIFYIL